MRPRGRQAIMRRCKPWMASWWRDVFPPREVQMTQHLREMVLAGLFVAGMGLVNDTEAQKAGGIWKVYSPDSPASMSSLEESTAFAVGPMMGVFNNLVLFDQHVKQNSLQSIVPDLATSWSWSVDGTKLTFLLRQGVKWHDGEPITAEDVECRSE